MSTKDEVEIALVGSIEGPSLTINGVHICGPKPWAGGSVEMSWKASAASIRAALGDAPRGPTTRWESNGEAGDANQICNGCDEVVADPHTWEECTAKMRKALAADIDAAIEAERPAIELAELRALRPREEYHEDYGPVLWWKVPIKEPPYCGTDLDDDFPDYMTHWSPVPQVWESKEGGAKAVVTCVYCGHAYPPGSPTHGAELLKEHIRMCEKHPMREIETALKDARDALNRDRTGLAAGLVDVVTRCRGTFWVTEGRGSYEWDDDRYKAETHVALTEVIAIASRALAASGTLAGEEVRKADEALRKAQAAAEQRR
ncbi:MAG: hypothetical protein HOW73_20190 [Polyangiaceae bacterium]|nr:hypothetical protein [Polyangiaceae bacterium]